MSPTPQARRLLASTFGVLLLRAAIFAQETAPLLPPVQESPLLLPVPKAPAGDVTAAAPSLAPSVPFATKTPSSTSASKQFTVHGGDLQLRSAFCLLCEDTAAALGRVLKDNGQWVLPVIVVLKTPPDITVTGPPVTLSIGELTHGGFHLQINAQLRTGFRTTDFTRQLVRVLLAERILRNHQKLNTTRGDVLPAWVMTGVAQALEYRSRSRPSALFSAVFRRGQVYSLDRILAADPTQLDALSRGIYETSTCALVLTLLDQPDGPVRFAKFLNALAADSKSDRDLLTQHFPNLSASKNALEKWWSLQMASLATPTAMETLSVAQTEDELDEALMLILPNTKAQEELQEQAAEKKSGGIFGWLKRDAKEEDAAGDKASQKSENTKPENETPKPEAKSGDKAKSAAVEQRAALPFPPLSFLTMIADTPAMMDSLGLSLPAGRPIIFPFKKKQAGETADAAEKKEADKASSAKPEAKPEPPKPAKPAADAAEKNKGKAEPPPAALSRKPGQTRSIGGRPEDLPKAPPPAAVPKTAQNPADEATKAMPQEAARETPQEANRRLLNPLNWFRKKPENPEAPADQDLPAATAKVQEPRRSPHAKAAPAARAPKPGTLPLEDFALIAKRPDRSDILNRCITRLSALKLRAHPLYKPLIADYSTLVQELVQEKTKDAAAKLESLRREREAVHDKAVAIESHLDWYEANHTGTLSHAFDDYLRLEEELEKERLPRSDALSKYLDAVEEEFQSR